MTSLPGEKVEILLAFERALLRGSREGAPVGGIFLQTRIAFYRALPYEVYLLTAHWLALRQQAIAAHGGRCNWCLMEGSGEAPLEAHHLTYERLGHERMSDLVALCHYCHARWHREERDPDWRPAKPLGVGGRQWNGGGTR